MIEYELSVNIKVENKEALDNLLITVESLQSGAITPTAVELLSIRGDSMDNKSEAMSSKNYEYARNFETISNYEKDSWLSPLTVKQGGSV